MLASASGGLANLLEDSHKSHDLCFDINTSNW